MKLGELLQEIKLGTDTYKANISKKEIEESFNEDLEIYKTSSLLKKYISSLTETINEDTAPSLKLLKKMEEKIKNIEEKEGDMSLPYTRMKLDSLLEDYNLLTDQLSSKKLQRLLDKEILAKCFAILEHNLSSLQNKVDIKELNKNDLPPIFEPFVRKELTILESILE